MQGYDWNSLDFPCCKSLPPFSEFYWTEQMVILRVGNGFVFSDCSSVKFAEKVKSIFFPPTTHFNPKNKKKKKNFFF